MHPISIYVNDNKYILLKWSILFQINAYYYDFDLPFYYCCMLIYFT